MYINFRKLFVDQLILLRNFKYTSCLVSRLERENRAAITLVDHDMQIFVFSEPDVPSYQCFMYL